MGFLSKIKSKVTKLVPKPLRKLGAFQALNKGMLVGKVAQRAPALKLLSAAKRAPTGLARIGGILSKTREAVQGAAAPVARPSQFAAQTGVQATDVPPASQAGAVADPAVAAAAEEERLRNADRTRRRAGMQRTILG